MNGGHASVVRASLVALEDVVSSSSRFDSRTGAPVPVRLGPFLRAAAFAFNGPRWRLPRDGLARQLELAGDALERIVDRPRERGVRTRVRLPWEKVRDQDVRCLTWLAKQAGATPREKCAQLRNVYAVVREPSRALHENQVALNVIRALARLAQARLAAVTRGELDARTAEGVLAQLTRVVHLERRARTQSPLALVTPASRLEPNNVLLSHPDYRLVWRASRWVSEQEERARVSLEQADAHLAAAVGLAFATSLTLRPDAIQEDQWVEPLVRPEREDGLIAVRSARWFVARTAADLRVVELHHEDGALVVSAVRLEGDGVLHAAPLRTSRIEVALVDDQPPLGRGAVARVKADVAGLPDRFFFDHDGVSELARALVEMFAGAEAGCPAVLVSGADAERPTPSKKVGWDLSRPHLVASLEAGDARPVGTLLAARLDSNGRLLTGSASGTWRRAEFVCAREVVARLSCGGNFGQPHRDLLSWALDRASQETVTRDGEVALAVSDCLDEYATARIRAALPTRLARSLFVPASVAAALEWRRRGGVFERGAEVLVLDAQGPLLTATPLAVRLEADRVEADDALILERLLPLQAFPGADGLGSRRWDELRAQDALEQAAGKACAEAATQAVSSGVWAQCDRDATSRAALVRVADEDRWALVRATSGARCAAEQRWNTLFTTWVAGLASAKPWQQDRPGQIRPRHVLLVGAPFDVPAILAHVRAAIDAAQPGVSIHAVEGGASVLASGAREALERRAAGLPTWRDVLPRLSLEVLIGADSTWIDLLGRTHAAPGEAIVNRPAAVFELPAGEPELTFPLKRHDEGRAMGVQFRAVLADAAFPLRKATRVRLEVQFRYAEDAFRIFVRPVESSPFEGAEIRWERDQCTLAVATRNEPPQLPPEDSWDGCGDAVAALVSASSRLRALVKSAVREKPKVVRGARNGGADKDWQPVTNSWSRVAAAIAEIRARIGELWCPGRSSETPPPVRPLTQELVPQLEILWGSRSSGKEAVHFQIRQLPKPDRDRVLFALRKEAALALAAFRWSAPASLLGELLAEAPGAGNPPDWLVTAIGRQLGVSAGPHVARAFDWILEQLSLDEKRASRWKRPLWALASGLCVGSRCLDALSERQEREACDRIEATFARTATEWCAERAASDLWCEAATVLVGLLRRRPGVSDPRLIAGSDPARQLAEQVAASAAAVRARGATPKSRIRFVGALPFDRLLADTLRGERTILIQAVEDEVSNDEQL